MIVPSWFCSWREVDFRSLKGNPDEENEEVMAWSFFLKEDTHTWVYTSRPVVSNAASSHSCFDGEESSVGWAWL